MKLVGQHKVINVGEEWDTGAGHDSQDSIRAGSEGVPGPGDRAGGGRAQNILHPLKKRKLDDNEFVGEQRAVTTHNNRTQPRDGDSGKRTFHKTKRRLKKQTDGQ